MDGEQVIEGENWDAEMSPNTTREIYGRCIEEAVLRTAYLGVVVNSNRALRLPLMICPGSK